MLEGFLVEGLRPPFSPSAQREYNVAFSGGEDGWERGGAYGEKRDEKKKGERGEKRRRGMASLNMDLMHGHRLLSLLFRPKIAKLTKKSAKDLLAIIVIITSGGT